MNTDEVSTTMILHTDKAYLQANMSKIRWNKKAGQYSNSPGLDCSVSVLIFHYLNRRHNPYLRPSPIHVGGWDCWLLAHRV